MLFQYNHHTHLDRKCTDHYCGHIQSCNLQDHIDMCSNKSNTYRGTSPLHKLHHRHLDLCHISNIVDLYRENNKFRLILDLKTEGMISTRWIRIPSMSNKYYDR